MRRFVPLLSVALAFASVFAAKQPWIDGETLAFRLPDLDGQIVSHTDERFEGKVLLIDLWGTWCPPCLSETPTFVDLQKRYGPRGLVVVGIAFEGEDHVERRRDRLRSYVEQQGVNFLVLDGGTAAEIAEALPALKGVRGLPVEILVDRSGRVVAARNGYGYKKRWARKLEAEIDELLGPAD